jgi:hypothetical protein
MGCRKVILELQIIVEYNLKTTLIHDYLALVSTLPLFLRSRFLLGHTAISPFTRNAICQLLTQRTARAVTLHLPTSPGLLITVPRHSDVLLRQPWWRMRRPSYERRIIHLSHHRQSSLQQKGGWLTFDHSG